MTEQREGGSSLVQIQNKEIFPKNAIKYRIVILN